MKKVKTAKINKRTTKCAGIKGGDDKNKLLVRVWGVCEGTCDKFQTERQNTQHGVF